MRHPDRDAPEESIEGSVTRGGILAKPSGQGLSATWSVLPAVVAS